MMWYGVALQDGDTALHMAARRGLRTAVDLLLDGGADPSAVNKVRGMCGIAPPAST
jgi:hypothetical protein